MTDRLKRQIEDLPKMTVAELKAFKKELQRQDEEYAKRRARDIRLFIYLAVLITIISGIILCIMLLPVL